MLRFVCRQLLVNRGCVCGCGVAERYSDWWSRFRRPGAVVRYGHAIQLSHTGTGELCGARLLRGNDRGLYELGLDTAMPDPYLEGRCGECAAHQPAVGLLIWRLFFHCVYLLVS